jgi:hypothetical protein
MAPSRTQNEGRDLDLTRRGLEKQNSELIGRVSPVFVGWQTISRAIEDFAAPGPARPADGHFTSVRCVRLILGVLV